jgi:xanthine dehydrogenase YagS FAD-binding subunit
MQDFQYERADSIEAALRGIEQGGARFIGGGTNLLDLMKGNVETATRLVDITHLPLAQVRMSGSGLSIGALMRNSDTANHPAVREHYPLLAQALVAGASPQLRNMATIGGNLMQRTRCGYFTDTAFAQCNKRRPGSGCAARSGLHRNHAIFGGSEQCIAVNPSDMNVALLALDARIQVRGARGQRTIPMAGFHRLPGAMPEQDTELAQGELITAVELPPSSFAAHSHYLKLRERSSFAFALVSVAVGLDLQGDTIAAARVVAGGVAPAPWRLQAVEEALTGRAWKTIDFQQLAALATRGAQPLAQNAYKVSMLGAAVARAVQIAGEKA